MSVLTKLYKSVQVCSSLCKSVASPSVFAGFKDWMSFQSCLFCVWGGFRIRGLPITFFFVTIKNMDMEKITLICLENLFINSGKISSSNLVKILLKISKQDWKDIQSLKAVKTDWLAQTCTNLHRLVNACKYLHVYF